MDVSFITTRIVEVSSELTGKKIKENVKYLSRPPNQ